MKHLITCPIPEDIRDIESHNDVAKLEYYKSLATTAQTSEDSYIALTKAMIQLEEAANSKQLASFDMNDIKLKLRSDKDKIFEIEFNVSIVDILNIKNIITIELHLVYSFQPKEINLEKAYKESLLDGFTLRPEQQVYTMTDVISGQVIGCREILAGNQQICTTNTVYAGEVIGCRENLMFVKITEGFEEILSLNDNEHQYFSINFFTNRMVYQLLLNALDWMKKHKLHSVLINNHRYDEIDYSIHTPIDLKLCCPYSDTLNEEQRLAVLHILRGKNHELPILLHGPPGTGKTRTLVAAIIEIVHTTEDFVLVLAHSNAACDELTMRLASVLKDGELFRLYAKSFNEQTLNDKIKPICNIQNNEFKFPSLEYLYKFRVVVTTILTSGSLVRARDLDRNFKSNHFSRIFIDEAGSIHEPETMIPIAGILSYFITI